MNRKKAILLSMVILIVAVSVPVSTASAQTAKPRWDAVQSPVSRASAQTAKPRSDAVPALLEQMFQRPGFFCPDNGTCEWIVPPYLARCYYRSYYCNFDYRYRPPRKSCYPYPSGW